MIIFRLLMAIFILCVKINLFKHFISIFAVSGVNATESRPHNQFLFLNTEVNKFEIWDVGMLMNTQWCLNLSFILLFLIMYLNHRLYSRKSIRSCYKIKTRYSIRCKGSNAKNSKSKKSLRNLLANIF